jgi:hypothetical protein
MGVAGTTLVADTASAGTARDTAPAGGKMGVAAHREAPLRAAIRKQADFRLSYGSAPGGSIHWLRDRSTARRAYSERLAPGLLAAQRDGAYPVEEQRRAAPKGVVHLAGLAPGRTPQLQRMRQSPELLGHTSSSNLAKGALEPAAPSRRVETRLLPNIYPFHARHQ